MELREEDWAVVSANKEVIMKHLGRHGNVLRRQNNEAVENLIERYQRVLPNGEEDWSAIALNSCSLGICMEAYLGSSGEADG